MSVLEAPFFLEYKFRKNKKRSLISFITVHINFYLVEMRGVEPLSKSSPTFRPLQFILSLIRQTLWTD